jgi:hypothetical protein
VAEEIALGGAKQRQMNCLDPLRLGLA